MLRQQVKVTMAIPPLLYFRDCCGKNQEQSRSKPALTVRAGPGYVPLLSEGKSFQKFEASQ